MRPLLVGIVLVPALCLGSASTPKSWQGKMQALADVTNELLPELVSRTPDRKRLAVQAKRLAGLAHALSDDAAKKMSRPPGDADASLPFIAGRFAEDAQSAYLALKNGHADYGVTILRSVTGHCIACHSRHDAGPDFPTVPLSPKTESLSRAEKADLLVATRQFDRAFGEYLAIVSDEKTAKAEYLEWERAVRHALPVAVRVKKSPEMASQLVDKVMAQEAAPEFVKRNAAKWKAAIENWKSEARPSGEVTEDALYEEMTRLLEEAQAAQQYPADTGANIGYLRASAVAHELLARFPDGKRAGEALFAAGVSYDVLADPFLWPSHEFYYEACVRRVPNTELAQRCFERFEQSIYTGYSGSGGTFIPEDAFARIGELKKLARGSNTPVP